MTDPINPGTNPEPARPTWDSTFGAPATGSPEPPLPPFEPAEPGNAAPAQTVQREPGTVGAPSSSRRSTSVRWAIALVGVALVLGVTAVVFALAGGRPTPSIAVGYMPDDVVQYGEYRFDLPGDQRQKLASFLSVFPGFDDQAPFDAKLDETFDRIVAAVSSNEQTYTADIKPWFGGIIALGSPPTAVPDASTPMLSVMGQQQLIVVTIKDRAKAADWIAGIAGDHLTRGEYNGAVLFSGASEGSGSSYAIAVNDEVILAGTDQAVRAAVDSKGDGHLADDDQFKAAFGIVSDDYVTFSFIDYKSMLASQLDMMNSLGGGALDKTAIDDELLSLVPAWFGSFGRFENDALVADSAFPSVDIGYDGHNKKSTLLGMAPPGTIAYGEVHDAGAALTAIVDRFRKQPELSDAFNQIDSATGIGLDGIYGWWGDAAFAVSEDSNGQLGGGLLIAPTDPAAATRAIETLRGYLVLGGGQAGIKLRDVQHGDTTITVVDFSGAAAAGMGELPAGYKPELAYAVTDQVVVIGYGQSFVESVLDAGPGPSLADNADVAALVKRVGEENLGMTYVDVRRIRELIEGAIKPLLSSAKWAEYVKEYQPFVLPFDAMAASVREDGSLDRAHSLITVSEP
jgi:hypothetical protein